MGVPGLEPEKAQRAFEFTFMDFMHIIDSYPGEHYVSPWTLRHIFVPRDQSVMLTTTAFVASFEFVVWTVSLSIFSGYLPFSLYTFLLYKQTWLGIATP